MNAFASHDVTCPFPKAGIPTQDLSESTVGMNPIQKELKRLEGLYNDLPTQRGISEERIGQHGTYDFINSRLLVFALSKDEWELTVDNLKELLSEYSANPPP